MIAITYKQDGNKIILSGHEKIDLAATLECGQCFNHEKRAATLYTVNTRGKRLFIEQSDDALHFYPCDLPDFEDIWIDYFDLARDYKIIMETLSANDYVMRDAVEYAGGIRMLNQEPWECLVSFILSQNRQIPMIIKTADNIRAMFGEPREGFHSFPSPARLSAASEAELKLCKTGFRAKYVMDAALKVHTGEIALDGLRAKKPNDARDILMRIYGVGRKVADCVMLYSLGHRSTFPTDVWIRRVMQHFYFGGKDVPLSEIQLLAEQKYGEYAGYANLYLFAYARQFKIGK